MSNSKQLPKFDFSAMNLTDDDFNTAVKETDRKESKHFRPGRYETQIIKSEYHSQAESDPTWSKWVITYQGAGEKTITDMVLVPTRSILYKTRDGENSPFPGKKLKQFFEALGETFSLDKLAGLCKTYFGTNDAMVGLNVVVDVGYTGNYVKYMGKQADGDTPKVQIVDRNGEVLDDTVFSDYKSANEYAEKKKISIRRFCDVMDYTRSSVGNKKAANDNW